MEAPVSVDWVGQVQDSLKASDGSYNGSYTRFLDIEKRAGLPDSLSYELAMAEGVGFEPTVSCPTPVFKTGAFVHSAIPPAISV